MTIYFISNSLRYYIKLYYISYLLYILFIDYRLLMIVVLRKFNTLNLPFNRESSNANVKVDPKFSHYNQSKIVEKILNKLEISKAHFIAHDRGVIVFEYLMTRNNDLFLSFSRGAQVWDYYEEEWSKLAPFICVGPPHRFMTKPWQFEEMQRFK